jgi:ethanolamine utilization protein EutP (predicted NTPase)
MNDLRELKNLGPYMVKIMNLIGIYTKADLMASDFKKIKNELVKVGIKPHLNIFYSIEMSLQNKPWNEISSEEKNEIKRILGDLY